MKLTEIEKRAIETAVNAFLRHCADAGHEERNSSKEEYMLASSLFSTTMELILHKDYGDPEIEENLNLGIWASSKEVISHLESLPEDYYKHQHKEPSELEIKFI